VLATAREALRDAIDEVRIDASMHRLLELRALQELNAGLVELPGDLETDLRRLVASGPPTRRLGLPDSSTPTEVQRAALSAAASWKRFRNDGRAGPAQQWVADVLGRTCEQLWSAAAHGGGSRP
jgi:hypothetical protein